jgi:ferredoxin--NADP+ reductase
MDIYFGITDPQSVLYHDEISFLQSECAAQFSCQYAFSEHGDGNLSRRYVQQLMESNIDEICSDLDNGAHIYFCGVKSMMKGIWDVFRRHMSAEVGRRRGDSFEYAAKRWREQGLWHTDIYEG